MDLAQAVNTRLLASSPVANLIGQRVTWSHRDQGGLLPALVLSSVGTYSEDPLEQLADYTETIVQADCYAKSHAEAWALSAAVIAALRDEAEIEELLFWNADVEGPIDLGEDSPQGFIHRASVSLTLRHSAAI